MSKGARHDTAAATERRHPLTPTLSSLRRLADAREGGARSIFEGPSPSPSSNHHSNKQTSHIARCMLKCTAGDMARSRDHRNIVIEHRSSSGAAEQSREIESHDRFGLNRLQWNTCTPVHRPARRGHKQRRGGGERALQQERRNASLSRCTRKNCRSRKGVVAQTTTAPEHCNLPATGMPFLRLQLEVRSSASASV